MVNTLVVILAILIVAPWFIWVYIRSIKKNKGYQIWFKKILFLSFGISYTLAATILIVLIILLT